MKKIFFLSVICMLLIVSLSFAGGAIGLAAVDIQPSLIRADADIEYKSTMSGNNSYESQCLYISKYQIIQVVVVNDTNKVFNINPNYFTLISNQNNAYSYSPETIIFKSKILFHVGNPLQAVDIYPNTKVSGFLLFEKTYENEIPKKIYFKNGNKQLSAIVTQDEKAAKARKESEKKGKTNEPN